MTYEEWKSQVGNKKKDVQTNSNLSYEDWKKQVTTPKGSDNMAFVRPGKKGEQQNTQVSVGFTRPNITQKESPQANLVTKGLSTAIESINKSIEGANQKAPSLNYTPFNNPLANLNKPKPTPMMQQQAPSTSPVVTGLKLATDTLKKQNIQNFLRNNVPLPKQGNYRLPGKSVPMDDINSKAFDPIKGVYDYVVNPALKAIQVPALTAYGFVKGIVSPQKDENGNVDVLSPFKEAGKSFVGGLANIAPEEVQQQYKTGLPGQAEKYAKEMPQSIGDVVGIKNPYLNAMLSGTIDAFSGAGVSKIGSKLLSNSTKELTKVADANSKVSKSIPLYEEKDYYKEMQLPKDAGMSWVEPEPVKQLQLPQGNTLLLPQKIGNKAVYEMPPVKVKKSEITYANEPSVNNAKKARQADILDRLRQQQDAERNLTLPRPEISKTTPILKPQFARETPFIQVKGKVPINPKLTGELLNVRKAPILGDRLNTLKNQLPDTTQYIASKTTKPQVGLKTYVKRGYSSMIDDLYPIQNVSKDTYTKAMNSRQADMIANRSLTSGLVDSSGKVIDTSLQDITSRIPRGLETQFSDYLINRRAYYWMKEGKKVFPDEAGMTPEKAIAKVEQYEMAHPEFKELGNRTIKWEQNLTKTWLVDKGILSPEQWEAMILKDPYYVPFQREFSPLEKGTGVFAKRGFVNQLNPMKKGVGSQRKIVDPIESIIEHTGQYIKTAKRNEVGQSLLNEVRQNPEAFKDFIEIVPPKTANASNYVINNINEILQKDGMEGLLDKFNEPWEKQQFISSGKAIEKGNNIVTVMEHGTPVHLKISDPDLLKALSNLSPQQATTITRAIGKFTQMVKTLTTGINPTFGLMRNVWRDLASGYINSKTIGLNPLGYAKYIWDLTKSVGNILAEPLGKTKFLPEVLRDIFKSGSQPIEYFKNLGGGGHVSAISGDRNLLSAAKTTVLPKSPLQKFTSIPKRLYHGVEALNNTLEVAPRLAEFKRTVKKTGDTDKALFEAQDLTVNFSRKGNVIKEADSIITYLNASLQGLDKVNRVYNPLSVGTKNAMSSMVKSVYAITIPTMVIYSINHNNPNYNNLSDYEKDNYFNVPNFVGPWKDGYPATFIKIPKPREQGVAFGALPERLLRSVKDKDPFAFNRFADTIKQNFAPPIEPVWQSGLDIWKTPEGRDWRGNPIVNQSLLNNSPRYQYDENTSEPAKFIGNIFNISPKKIDATAKSYLGVIGQLGIPGTTKGKSIGDVLKSQFIADPLYTNDILNDFYSNLNKLNTQKADAKQLGNDINTNMLSGFNKISNDISTLRSLMRQVEIDNTLSKKQKEDSMKDFQNRILDLANRANKMYNSKDTSYKSKYPELINNYPEPSFTYKKETITLTPSQYFEYKRIIDNNIKELLKTYSISSYLNEEDRQKAIESIISKAQDNAKKNMLLKLRGPNY